MRPEPAAPPASEQSPPAAVGTTAVPVEPSAGAGPSPGANREPAAMPSITPSQDARQERPPADFVFDAPGHLARSPRRPIDDGARVERVPAARPRAETNTEAVAAPRPVSLARPAVGPDPVAAALAAAVRWTSSETTPGQRQARTVEPAMARRTSRDERATVLAPTIDHQPDVARQPAPTPPEKPQRYSDVHIGSIEVEIVSPPEPAQPETPTTATTTPRDFGIPIARKITSHYGLRQR